MAVFPSDPQLATSLQATTDSVKDAIPECAGLSISLVRNEAETLTFVRTDTLTGVLDAVQYLDDGLCESAVRSGDEVRVGDIRSDDNWPLFAHISAAAGILSSLSLPLRRGPTLVGSVNMYGDTAHAFNGREAVDLANTFAVHVQAMVTHANLSQPPIPDAQKHADPADQAIIDEAGRSRRNPRVQAHDDSAPASRGDDTRPHLPSQRGSRDPAQHAQLTAWQ